MPSGILTEGVQENLFTRSYHLHQLTLSSPCLTLHKKEPSQAPFPYLIYQDIIWLYFPSLMRMAVLLTTGMSAAITQRIVSTPMVVKLYIKE